MGPTSNTPSYAGAVVVGRGSVAQTKERGYSLFCGRWGLGGRGGGGGGALRRRVPGYYRVEGQ